MVEDVGGVRDHLANERTHLAWLRTSANVMVVGLVVARFAGRGSVSAASLSAGGLLLLTGAVGVGYGTLRYRRVASQLREGMATAAMSTAGPTIASIVLLLATVGATVILVVSK